MQQRVNGVQSQIEVLQGELKALRDQSADATLRGDRLAAGLPSDGRRQPITHARASTRPGHTSIDRFARGFDSIVAALGPLLLAVLLIGAVVLLGRFGYRLVRRATT